MTPKTPPPSRPPSHGSFQNQRVLVLGLGRFGGGTGVSRWLVHQGARVIVTDQADKASLADSLAELRDLDIEFRLGGHDASDLDGVDRVVINPAVDKAKSPFFREIQHRGIPWTTELNLFCERCPARVIGVTGSYGKSTTGAMLYDILAASCQVGGIGYTGAHFGGNIGRSLLNDLEHIRATDIVVLEMSNAQLEDLPRIDWTPDVAVITNLYPHHLQRHGSFENYVRAKLNILRPAHDGPAPGESLRSSGHAASAPADKSGDDRQPVILGDVAAGAELWLNQRLHPERHRVHRITPPESPLPLRVPGWHNQINAATALKTVRVLGLHHEPAREALAAFRGLPHRVELVTTIDGVDYYNDSKSTSPSATMAALDCFDRPVVAIVGGQRKREFDYDGCAAALVAKCRAVVCTGASRSDWVAALDRVMAAIREGGVIFAKSENDPTASLRETVPPEHETVPPEHETVPPDMPIERQALPIVIREAATLDEAVMTARSLARRGDVVLFSPGAPSFDTHANYSERGAAFCGIVRSLT